MKKLFNLFLVALAIGALFIGCKKDADDDSINVPTTTHYSQPSGVDQPSSKAAITLTEGTWELKMGFESSASSTSTSGSASISMDQSVSGNTIQKFTVDDAEGHVTFKSGSMYEKIVWPGMGALINAFGGAEGLDTVETDPDTGFKTKTSVIGDDLVVYAWGNFPKSYIDEQNAANPTVAGLMAEIEDNAEVKTNTSGTKYYITYEGFENVDDSSGTESSSSVQIAVNYTVIIQKK